MKSTKPACGHSALKPNCKSCRAFTEKWYLKIQSSDPEWRDIEYGLDTPQLIYQPVDVGTINLEAMAYYDKVWAVYHEWVKVGRSKRDCTVAELLAKQDGETGTVRGISTFLKSNTFKHSSKFFVEKTIKEINAAVLQIRQVRLGMEQASKALLPLDSKPLKEEANGETTDHSNQGSSIRAA